MRITMVLKFSDYATVEGDKAKCKVCAKVIGKRLDTWSRHYNTFHPDELKSLKGSGTLVLTPFETRNEYVENVMEILTECNTPFSFWSHPAVRKNQQCFADKFNVTCSADSFSKMLKVHSKVVRRVIELELKGRLVGLKLDVATRKGRSILCISVQFVKMGRIHIRYLTMATIPGAATTEMIQDMIDECLRKYNLDKKLIYSITTDNGSNMLKASKLTLEEVDWAIDNEDAEVIRGIIQEYEDDDDGEEDESQPVTRRQSMPNIFEDPNAPDEDAEDELDRNIYEAAGIYGSKRIRCAAHVIQLAVHDFMKRCERTAIVNKAKDAVKEIRKYIRSLPVEFRNRPKLPKLANDTRWSSTYNMVSYNIDLTFTPFV